MRFATGNFVSVTVKAGDARHWQSPSSAQAVALYIQVIKGRNGVGSIRS
jgi:hypothetical protein